jgi:replicative DNA helicase
MLDNFPGAPLTDLPLEQALVALIFADNTNLDRLGRLSPDDLVDPFLGATLAAALDQHAEGQPANLVTLKPRLEAMALNDGRTGLDALRALTLNDKRPAVEDIVHRLRSLAVKRRLRDEMTRLAEAITDESQPIATSAADGIRQLNDYLADAISETKTSFELHPAAHEFIAWLQGDGDPVEIPTGLVELDKTLGGWHRGQFVLLGGRTSMGKSAIALASMLRTAARGHGVLFFSLEMTKHQIVARALADFAYAEPAIAYSDLKPKRVPRDQIKRLRNAAEAFKGLPLEIETRNGLTVGDILAKARKTAEDFKARGHELTLLVVDHLLKVRPSNRYAGQSVKEIDEVSEAMCVMAKSLNVAVLGLHQLNRQPQHRDNHRPVLNDLRGSGSLEQDADVVLFAYRPAYEYERQLQEGNEAREAEVKLAALKHDLEIQVAKQRQGPLKTLRFFVDMAANVVRDLEWGTRA